jgi:hypothetical protein
MDGDMQNDPHDIPRLLEKIDDGFDVVSGWRKDRQDDAARVLPSKIASQGYFDATVVARLIREHLDGRRDNRKQLWTLFAFQLWREGYSRL